LLSREEDRHQEAPPTSKLGWHPGMPPSYVCQSLKFINKGKNIYKERGGVGQNSQRKPNRTNGNKKRNHKNL